MFCYSLANDSPGSAPWPHTTSATDFDKSMSHRILRTTSKGKRQYRSVDFSSRIVDFQRHEEEGLILLLKQVVANSHQLSANDGSQHSAKTMQVPLAALTLVLASHVTAC